MKVNLQPPRAKKKLRGYKKINLKEDNWLYNDGNFLNRIPKVLPRGPFQVSPGSDYKAIKEQLSFNTCIHDYWLSNIMITDYGHPMKK